MTVSPYSASSYLSQTPVARPPSEQNETKPAHIEQNKPPSATSHNTEVNSTTSPTVNTSGQTVGRLINISA